MARDHMQTCIPLNTLYAPAPSRHNIYGTSARTWVGFNMENAKLRDDPMPKVIHTPAQLDVHYSTQSWLGKRAVRIWSHACKLLAIGHHASKKWFECAIWWCQMGKLHSAIFVKMHGKSYFQISHMAMHPILVSCHRGNIVYLTYRED